MDRMLAALLTCALGVCCGMALTDKGDEEDGSPDGDALNPLPLSTLLRDGDTNDSGQLQDNKRAMSANLRKECAELGAWLLSSTGEQSDLTKTHARHQGALAPVRCSCSKFPLGGRGVTHRCSCAQQEDDWIFEALIQNGKEALGRHLRVCVGTILAPGGLHCLLRKAVLFIASQSCCQAMNTLILLIQRLLVLVLCGCSGSNDATAALGSRWTPRSSACLWFSPSTNVPC